MSRNDLAQNPLLTNLNSSERFKVMQIQFLKILNSCEFSHFRLKDLNTALTTTQTKLTENPDLSENNY